MRMLLIIALSVCPMLVFAQLKGEELHSDYDMFCGESLFFVSDSIAHYYAGCEERQQLLVCRYTVDAGGEIHFRSLTADEFLKTIVVEKTTVPLSSWDTIMHLNPDFYLRAANGNEWNDLQLTLYNDTLPIVDQLFADRVKGSAVIGTGTSFSVDFIDLLFEEPVIFDPTDFSGTGEDILIHLDVVNGFYNTQLRYSSSSIDAWKLKYVDGKFYRLSKKTQKWEEITTL